MSFCRTIALLGAFLLIVSLAGCGRTPEEVFSQAQQQADTGNYRAAMIELKSLLQDNPDNLRARWLLGSVYLDIEDGASAEKELSRAKSLGVADDSSVPLLLRAMLLQGKADEVLAFAVPAMSAQATAESDAARGLAYLYKGQPDLARQHIDAAVAAMPGSSWVSIAQAKLLLSNDQTAEAKSVLASITSRDPGNGVAWSMLGDVEFSLKAFAGAEAAYTNAIEHRYINVPDRVRRGHARLAQGNLDGAAEDAEMLADRAAKSARAQLFVGIVRYQQQEYAVAAEAMEKAYAIDARDLATRYVMALVQLRLGSDERALDLAEGIVAEAPNFMGGRKLLAGIYLQQEGKAAAAEEMLARVVLADPTDLSSRDALATALILQGKAGEASELLEQIASQRGDNARAQLRAGVGLLSAGRRDEAVSSLKRATDLAPNEQAINVLAVSSLLGAAMGDEALLAAKQFAERNPEDPVAWNLLGNAYFANQQLELGAQAFERALEVNPGDPKATEKLALLAIRSENYASARDMLEGSLRFHPEDPKLDFRLAVVELREKNLYQAKVLLERAITADPTRLEPRLALGQLLIDQNEPERALTVISQASFPENPAILQLRAAAFMQLEQYADAKIALEGLRRYLPDSATVHFLLARAYAQLGDRSSLDKALERVLEIAPESPQALLVRAELLTVDRRFDEAGELLDRVALPPRDPNLLTTRLFLERARKDRTATIRVARQLFESRPSTESALALASAFVDAGDLESAETSLSRWTQQNPGDSAALRVLSQLYIRTGNERNAVEALDRLVIVAPGDSKAHNNLAWYLRETDPARALAHAETAYDLTSDAPEVLDTYAEVLARNGNVSLALETMDLAVEKGSQDPMLRLRRAELYKRVGRGEQALEELTSLLAEEQLPDAVNVRARELSAAWSKGG